jgi:hypothetical protein
VTRFVVDAGVVVHLASTGAEVSDEHELLAPTLLRSQTLSLLHEAVHRGEIPANVAHEHLARIGRMQIRLLSETPCSGAGPGSWRTDWVGLGPTTPSTSRSRSCRRMRS